VTAIEIRICGSNPGHRVDVGRPSTLSESHRTIEDSGLPIRREVVQGQGHSRKSKTPRGVRAEVMKAVASNCVMRLTEGARTQGRNVEVFKRREDIKNVEYVV